MSFLSVENLHVSYKREDKKRAYAVQGLSIQLDRQETLGIVGETGAGKTTTALAIMGLLPGRGRIDAGSVILDGTELVGLNDASIAAGYQVLVILVRRELCQIPLVSVVVIVVHPVVD